jgi:hypothetical protein
MVTLHGLLLDVNTPQIMKHLALSSPKRKTAGAALDFALSAARP